MPWAARDNQNLAVLYRMHSDYKAGLDCRTDPNRCVLTIEDKNRWTTHKIALNRSGILEVDGQTHDIAGSTVSVTEQRGSIVIAVDNEEILSFN